MSKNTRGFGAAILASERRGAPRHPSDAMGRCPPSERAARRPSSRGATVGQRHSTILACKHSQQPASRSPTRCPASAARPVVASLSLCGGLVSLYQLAPQRCAAWPRASQVQVTVYSIYTTITYGSSHAGAGGARRMRAGGIGGSEGRSRRDAIEHRRRMISGSLETSGEPQTSRRFP